MQFMSLYRKELNQFTCKVVTVRCLLNPIICWFFLCLARLLFFIFSLTKIRGFLVYCYRQWTSSLLFFLSLLKFISCHIRTSDCNFFPASSPSFGGNGGTPEFCSWYEKKKVLLHERKGPGDLVTTFSTNIYWYSLTLILTN